MARLKKIKYAVNRNILDLSRNMDNVKTQDIIKGIESVLQCKSKHIDCVQNLDKILEGKSLKELKVTNDMIVEKSSELLEGEDEDKESIFNENTCHKKVKHS